MQKRVIFYPNCINGLVAAVVSCSVINLSLPNQGLNFTNQRNCCFNFFSVSYVNMHKIVLELFWCFALKASRDSLTKIWYAVFWCRWIDKYFLHLFYLIRFLKYHRFHVEFSNIKRSAVSFY
jgi:hypothetical protein